MQKMKVRLTFTETVLGTWPNDKEIAANYIASKAPDADRLDEEIDALGVDAIVERGMTVFPRYEGKPCLYDYQVKGFFKDSCSMLQKAGGKDEETGKKKVVNACGKLTAYKKVIDGLVFVSPRQIPISTKSEIGSLQRPLRAQTAQGERVSLVNSEEIAAGATVEFEIKLLNSNLIPAIKEMLDYGELRGIGQWRNGGHGTFVWDELDEKGNIIGGNNPNPVKPTMAVSWI